MIFEDPPRPVCQPWASTARASGVECINGRLGIDGDPWVRLARIYISTSSTAGPEGKGDPCLECSRRALKPPRLTIAPDSRFQIGTVFHRFLMGCAQLLGLWRVTQFLKNALRIFYLRMGFGTIGTTHNCRLVKPQWQRLWSWDAVEAWNCPPKDVSIAPCTVHTR